MEAGRHGSGKPGRPTSPPPAWESLTASSPTSGESPGAPIAAVHGTRAHPTATHRISSAEVTMADSDPTATARQLAERGWPVLPCHTPCGDRCSCGTSDCPSPGKHPRTRHGLHDATCAPDAITRWWRRWPAANPAVRTGASPDGAGIVVIDIDPDAGGAASFERLTTEHRQLPATLEVHTGSGGRHLYFAHPGTPIPNSAGRVGAGIDVRGDGGYVLVPPSTHRSGGTYRWASCNPLSELPAWLLDLIDPACRRSVAPAPAAAPNGRAHTAWASAALHGEATNVRSAIEGCRNHTLNRAAFALGQLVAGGHLDEHEVVTSLTAAGLAAGLGEREIRTTISSGLGAGREHPRHPTGR